jgi:hypothetical protein
VGYNVGVVFGVGGDNMQNPIAQTRGDVIIDPDATESLYEACKTALECFEGFYTEEAIRMTRILKEAIAKAED